MSRLIDSDNYRRYLKFRATFEHAWVLIDNYVLKHNNENRYFAQCLGEVLMFKLELYTSLYLSLEAAKDVLVSCSIHKHSIGPI